MKRSDEYEHLQDCDGCKKPVPVTQLFWHDEDYTICESCLEDMASTQDVPELSEPS